MRDGSIEAWDTEKLKEVDMSQQDHQQRQSWLSRLGEDWIAVIIALGLVLLVWIGVITNVPWPLFGFLK